MTGEAAKDLQFPRERVGDELVGQRVGRPRRRFVPAGNTGYIGALAGIGVERTAKDQHG
jgi:hypothetical protein